MQITNLTSYAYFFDIWYNEKLADITHLKNVFPESEYVIDEVLELLSEKPINTEFYINENWSNSQ